MRLYCNIAIPPFHLSLNFFSKASKPHKFFYLSLNIENNASHIVSSYFDAVNCCLSATSKKANKFITLA